MMKKIFLFNVKTPFCSRGIHVFVLTFGYIEKRLEKNTMVNFKIYDVTEGTTIIIHVLPNISRSTVNQAMKLAQLMKYSGRDIFLQKSCKK